MHWVTYHSSADDADHPGLLKDGQVYGARGKAALIDLIDDNDVLAAAAEQAQANPLEVIPVDHAELLSPIPVPPSIRDFMAFEEHVLNARLDKESLIQPIWYNQPVFYFSNPAAVRGPREDIEISPGSSMFDYEMEIGAVIGKPGRDLTPEEAEAHIAGYMLLCDWSARDLQGCEMKMGLGPAKGKDGATSLGPALVTPDELEPFRERKGYRLSLSTSVNGTPYSKGNWSTIHWSFAQMISFASRGTTVRTGDVIGSGTVGSGCILELSVVHGPDTYPWLKPGDDVRIECDQLGVLTGHIVEGSEPAPL